MKEIEIDETKITIHEVYVHFHFKKGSNPISKSAVEEAHSIVAKELQSSKKYLLVTTEEGVTLTEPARDFASSESFDEFIKADAVVTRNYSHEISANFFIRFNRPNRPVKLFPNEEKAINWINELKKIEDEK